MDAVAVLNQIRRSKNSNELQGHRHNDLTRAQLKENGLCWLVEALAETGQKCVILTGLASHRIYSQEVTIHYNPSN